MSEQSEASRQKVSNNDCWRVASLRSAIFIKIQVKKKL